MESRRHAAKAGMALSDIWDIPGLSKQARQRPLAVALFMHGDMDIDLRDAASRFRARCPTAPGAAVAEPEAGQTGLRATLTAHGHSVHICDVDGAASLSRGGLPGSFDLALQCAEDARTIDQLSLFARMHACVRAGGYMAHFAPSLGIDDYVPLLPQRRLFLEVATANDYAIIVCRLIETGMANDRESFVGADSTPSLSLFVVFQKREEGPFRPSLETSTTVGAVSSGIAGGYGAANLDGDSNPPSPYRPSSWRKAFAKLGRLRVRHVLSLDAARALRFAMRSRSTPKATSTLAEFSEKLPPGLQKQIAKSLAFDGVEGGLDLRDDREVRFSTLMAAMLAYDERGLIDAFPLELQAEAIRLAALIGSDSRSLRIRTGKVLAQYTHQRPIQTRSSRSAI